jgi:secreted PhoX family phosphatase
MIDRRRFLQCIAAAAAPSGVYGCQSTSVRRGKLQKDPNKILSVSEGLSYQVVSRAGDKMSDGFVVPGAHDGMAAFAGDSRRIILVCNHELGHDSRDQSAFGRYKASQSHKQAEGLYDAGNGKTPGPGGTTTTVWNPVTGKTERQHLSLGGTETNCAGGRTPWGSWLSCEECFEDPGTTKGDTIVTTRDKRHGYVFEVPAHERRLVAAQPIKGMGRFEHEACAVHDASGIVYLTEDKHHSCFYRYIPNVPGKLLEGGRLQALAIANEPAMKTHNWESHDVRLNTEMATHWIDLQDVDSDENDLRLRAAADGAATFARGEGLTTAGDRLVFTCTIGGAARLGQVFAYTPSPYEGTTKETQTPGHLAMIAESGLLSLLRNPDNLTMAPWGDLIVCEDTALNCGVIGITPEGEQYHIADNPYSDSELAGVCFSPDGKTMFVNIQYPGMTLAISGEWPV